jgi:hypothetical protein
VTPDEFVRLVQHDVIDDVLEVACGQLLEADRTHLTGSHPHWQKALQLFDSASPEEQDTLLAIMRGTAVDTVSYLFGIFAGTSQLAGRFERFRLTYVGNRLNPPLEEVILSGDLQDFFLGQEQDEEGIDSH